jgi:hypothetical protein
MSQPDFIFCSFFVNINTLEYFNILSSIKGALYIQGSFFGQYDKSPSRLLLYFLDIKREYI